MGNELLEQHIQGEYKWGFTTDIDSETFAPGLNENVIHALSAKKMNQPGFLNTD
jgi:Fe-S cluster assembly protein SufB